MPRGVIRGSENFTVLTYEGPNQIYAGTPRRLAAADLPRKPACDHADLLTLRSARSGFSPARASSVTGVAPLGVECSWWSPSPSRQMPWVHTSGVQFRGNGRKMLSERFPGTLVRRQERGVGHGTARGRWSGHPGQVHLLTC